MLVTILTPTHNRASLLPRLYESLCRQTCMDFEWLVVDDGSTDKTRMLVQGMALKATFPIRYFYKGNGGKHTAVNVGVRKAKGELAFVADSDDMLLPTSVETVATIWKDIGDDDRLAGLAGLDIDALGGKVVGSGLPQEQVFCNAMDIRYRYHVTGDLKEVFRTSVLREFPFPEICGENFCPEQLCWFRIAQKYRLCYINTPLYIADYQDGGITANITKARMLSPIATMMTYGEMLGYGIPVREKVRAAINYWRFRCCARKGTEEAIPVSWRWMWTRPLGWLMHLRDRWTTARQ